MNKSTEATPEDANHSLARRIGDKPQKFWDKVLWTDFMDKSDGTAKVWRKKDLLMIPNIQAHLKHSGGNVMAWAFIASSGTGSLIFINDVTHDGSSKINSEVYRNILSDNLQKDATKLIGRSFIIQQDNDPKQQRSSSGQEVEGFRLAKSISTLKPYRACLLPAKEETEGSNPPNWKRLRWKPGKASQKKNAKVWWCQWVTGLMQLLKAKDLQLNISCCFFHFNVC